MLINTEELDKNKQNIVPDSNNPYATSSASAFHQPPPTFDESVGDHVLQFSQDDTCTPVGGEEPPPFVPYDAQFFTAHSGDIISHDPHLNDDGMFQVALMSSHSKPFQVRPCTVSYSHKPQHPPPSSCDAKGRIMKLTRG